MFVILTFDLEVKLTIKLEVFLAKIHKIVKISLASHTPAFL